MEMMYNKYIHLEEGLENADRERRVNQDLLEEKIRMGIHIHIYILIIYLSHIFIYSEIFSIPLVIYYFISFISRCDQEASPSQGEGSFRTATTTIHQTGPENGERRDHTVSPSTNTKKNRGKKSEWKRRWRKERKRRRRRRRRRRGEGRRWGRC
jgi:hypothetical protein